MVMEFTYQSLPKQGDNSWPPMGVQEFFCWVQGAA
jgi:hypothetical protein